MYDSNMAYPKCDWSAADRGCGFYGDPWHEFAKVCCWHIYCNDMQPRWAGVPANGYDSNFQGVEGTDCMFLIHPVLQKTRRVFDIKSLSPTTSLCRDTLPEVTYVMATTEYFLVSL